MQSAAVLVAQVVVQLLVLDPFAGHRAEPFPAPSHQGVGSRSRGRHAPSAARSTAHRRLAAQRAQARRRLRTLCAACPVSSPPCRVRAYSCTPSPYTSCLSQVLARVVRVEAQLRRRLVGPIAFTVGSSAARGGVSGWVCYVTNM